MASPKSIHFDDFFSIGDWHLNGMLLEISLKLDQDDVRRMKFLLSGTKGVGNRELDNTTTAEDFFKSLKNRMMLTRNNVLLLQALLRRIKREDLLIITENYAREIGDTLFIHEPPSQPENGFLQAKFHVDGNLNRFQRPKLEELREYVAGLLDVPQEFIFLVGVEGGSVILTFMISEQYADQLKDLFEKHKEGFRQYGVNGIFVVDPPTIDEQSMDPRAESEENKVDFSTQTNLDLAPVGDIQSQLSAMYVLLNQMTSQLGELEQRTDDRVNQVTSQSDERQRMVDFLLNEVVSQSRRQEIILGKVKRLKDRPKVFEYSSEDSEDIEWPIQDRPRITIANASNTGSEFDSDLHTEDEEMVQHITFQIN